MIKTIAAVELPVDETLEIKRNRIVPEEPTDDMKRISIVTGIHGDELEGQYICFELQRRIEQCKECLAGIVDIYPAMNPLGIDSITREIPAFDLDMNRLFPGDIDGSMTEHVIARIMEDVAGSDCVLDIHASNIYLTEIPQIRINELYQDTLVPMAGECNADFIWVHGASTVLESTFAYSLNHIGTPALVVEMGVGMRITQQYGNQMVDGIIHLMKKIGIWKGKASPVRKPIISRNPEDVSYLNARVGGVFLPTAPNGIRLKKGLYRDTFRVTGYEFGEGEKSICIVGSSRGNEVQQMYCCSLLVRKMKQLEHEGKIMKGHKILILPSINPYSMNIRKRFWTTDHTDINRMFPGYDLGETTQRIADGVFREISEYQFGIQFTSFYMPGDFVPHVRLMDQGFSNPETAKQFGLPYVVIRKVRPYDTATLNYNWQASKTQAFSLYTSATSRIDSDSAGQAVLAVMNFLSKQGMIKYNVADSIHSKVVYDDEVILVKTAKSGFFQPLIKVGEKVEMGQPLANILDPYEGEILETLYAPFSWVAFFVHNEPLTYANTAVIKLIEKY